MAGACGDNNGSGTVVHRPHVIEIDIDDHGLAGLAMANAPNIKGLIARGTLAYTRVIVPTHSNQSNMALLTGQYPEGDNVPSNSWLAREDGFHQPLSLPGFSVGDYVLWDRNPLRTRGDSVYQAAARQHLRSAYVGPLPPFDVGADDAHLTIVGLSFGTNMVSVAVAKALLTGVLKYPQATVDSYHFEGPPVPGETQTHFTMKQAAALVRQTSPARPMPDFMFVFDFVALDGDPTSETGASGAGIIKIIEDYDSGVGDLLAALTERQLLDDTNIVFTLDHGKVDTHNQVVLGTHGTDAALVADGQLGALVTAQGPALGIAPTDYAILNEDGDALIYARTPDAGAAAGAARQAQVTAALLSLIQSGAGITGLDTTRTMTADGAMGTRRFHDFRGSGPHQADIVVFPRDDWTLNQVDAALPAGPFHSGSQVPYGRHGGFSVDELYVPLIMAGPAFKKGVLLPHPVEHPQVAPTALSALPGVALNTAASGAISAALVDHPGETVAQPNDLATAREQVLRGSGYLGGFALAGAPAQAVIVIDVAGLYDDEVFGDAALADAAGPLRALAQRGTRFQDFWLRYRDWPVTEFQMLTGGYPVAVPWISTAEDDPTAALIPAAGLLAIPPPAGRIANQAAFDAWRQPVVWADDTLFDAARRLGATTALIGQPDFHDRHLAAASIDVRADAAGDSAPGVLRDLITRQPNLLAVVALGGVRTADRHAAGAIAELATIATAVSAVVDAAPDALIVLTSRGAATIDDPAADFYGPGSARHVPFVIVGPNVRAGIVTSQPGSAADLPATVLVAMGAPVNTDFVEGTWAAGSAVGGIFQPSPRGATAGHALVRAFNLASPP